MEKNKDLIITALAVLLVVGSIWGAVGNKSAKKFKGQLEVVTVELDTLKTQEARLNEKIDAQAVLGTKELKEKEQQLHAQEKQFRVKTKQLELKDSQLASSRKELFELRKGVKGLEAELSKRDALIQKLQKHVAVKQEKGAATGDAMVALKAQLKKKDLEISSLSKKFVELKKQLLQLKKVGATAQKQQLALESKQKVVTELQKKLVAAEGALVAAQDQVANAGQTQEKAMADIAGQVETANAQVIGLEKIVEEKNAMIEETSQELDRIKINMDVLLAKISEQQDTLQEIQEENVELIKDLTMKKEQIADLEDQVLQSQVKQ